MNAKFDREAQLISWLKNDSMRMEALQIAASLQLKDWCIAAGFVRNLVWDKLHEYSDPTPLNDIDLIYFDSSRPTKAMDESIEKELIERSGFPWSVKNQARMHSRNNDDPYTSTSQAMRQWVELETAIGARLSSQGQVQLIAPFGINALFSNTITINPGRIKPFDFRQRVENKRWLQLWPNLKIAPTNRY